MREILFRAKRLDNGEWVYGSYYHCCGTAYGATFIVVNDFGFIEVIAHTVGQYTGLNDKNNVKIFEGDIVKFVRYGVVTWHEVLGGFVLFFRPQNPFGSSLHWMLFDIGICPYEVIGNIHDNPEILGDD